MNKVYTAARNSTIKYQTRLEACQSKIKAIPENATIREEYVKCKKHNCHRKHHGLYYYAYWKDPESKKLRKKYIGRYCLSDDEFKDQLKEKAKDSIEELPIGKFWK